MKKLKLMSQRQYVRLGGTRCPFPGCGSDQIEGGPIEVDAGGCTQEITCLKCGGHWYDTYKLDGYIVVTEQFGRNLEEILATSKWAQEFMENADLMEAQ